MNENTKNMKKNYTHDCESCIFLGDYEFDGTKYDLYFCSQMQFVPTVIARYGDEGSEYMSGLKFGETTDCMPLYEAKMRATNAGFITK